MEEEASSPPDTSAVIASNDDGVPNDNRLGSREPPEPQPTLPGAVAVAGPNADSSDDDYTLTPSEPPPEDPNFSPLVTAELVHDREDKVEELEEQLRQKDEQLERVLAERDNAAVAQVISDEDPEAPDVESSTKGPDSTSISRRKHVIAVFLVLLLLCVVLAAVLVKQSRSSPAHSPAPTALPTTTSPTSSPAPTSLTEITAIIQLDGNPGQTGWELSCDGETLEKAEPGTYGIVKGRPNYRIKYETIARIGAECELTLTDLGGDGLDPGFFEVYYGTNLGDQSTRITSGSMQERELTVKFEIGDNSDTTTNSPTATATSSPNPTICTLCPDGSEVLFPEAKAPIGALTCKEVEELAAAATNETHCKSLQDSASARCGCRNSCATMCPDGVSGPDPANFERVVAIKNDSPVTCADFQSDIASSASNSVDECLSANLIGEDMCGCPPTEVFCRLCEPTEGGQAMNPSYVNMEKEIAPGVTCRDITGIGYSLKRGDPTGVFFRLCPAVLAIGAYCGCDQRWDGREFCRLCGGSHKLLPEPSRLVDSKLLGQNTTCLHVELAANIIDPETHSCEVYKQDATLGCCFDA